MDEGTSGALLPKIAVSIIEASEQRTYEGRHPNQKSIFQELLQANDNQEAIETNRNRKCASYENAHQEEERARRDTGVRKQNPALRMQKPAAQGFCFNSAHGCPLPRLVPLAHQAGVCSTHHYELLKHFYMENAASKRNQDLFRMPKPVAQGFCFNSAHGCPLPRLVSLDHQAGVCSIHHYELLKHFFMENVANKKNQDPLRMQKPVCFNSAHGCPLPRLVPQAGVCSPGHHQLLKHFYMGQDGHCLPRGEGQQRTRSGRPSWLENGAEESGDLFEETSSTIEEEPAHVAKSKKMESLWWWTALSSTQAKTCPWKTLLQSFLVEVEQVLRRYRLKVEQEGKQAWLGRSCTRRSGGGGWWNSCGVITS